MQIDTSSHPATVGLIRPAIARVQRAAKSRDRYLLFVTAAAIVISIVSFAFFYSQHLTLLYYDGQARLLITRRVVDSPTSGLAQLGAVWLPLTHLLALPFIGNDFLYRSGIALSIISMA